MQKIYSLQFSTWTVLLAIRWHNVGASKKKKKKEVLHIFFSIKEKPQTDCGVLNEKKKNQKHWAQSLFNCCVWVAAQLDALHAILGGKQGPLRYRQRPDLFAIYLLSSARAFGEGAKILEKGEGKADQTNYFPSLSPSGLFCLHPTFDLLMLLFVGVMKTEWGGSVCSTTFFRSSQSKLSFSCFFICHDPPPPLPTTTTTTTLLAPLFLWFLFGIHVALWPHTIDLYFLIVPPGR